MQVRVLAGTIVVSAHSGSLTLEKGTVSGVRPSARSTAAEIACARGSAELS